MKVLQLCFSNSLGGNELYVERIGPALARRGHEVIYALRRGSPLAQRLPAEKSVLFDPGVPYADVFTALKLARFARRSGVEVLHVHLSRDLPYAALVKQFNPRLRVIYTRQMMAGGRKGDPFHRWIYGKIDLILTITRQMQGQLADRLPMPAGRIKCLYLGAAIPDLSARHSHRATVRARYGISDSDFVVLFPNRLDPQKGQLLLVEALALVKQRGLTPKVLFMGRETEDCAGFTQILQQAIDRAGVAGQCIITGFIDDTGPFYAAADVTALATREETFGMVLIESMAWGTPVIGSKAGGVPEIIDHGRNGFLFTSMDAAALAGAIERCMRDRESLTELGENGRRTVEEKFDFSRHLEALEGYYRG